MGTGLPPRELVGRGRCLPSLSMTSALQGTGSAEGGGQGTKRASLDRTSRRSPPGLIESQAGPLTVMAAPGVTARDSRAGLRGAPSPPPLSATGRRSSSPSLPRSCPGPFHPPIKLFFFFQTSWEDPDEPMGGLESGANSGGGSGRTNESEGRVGGGACAMGRPAGRAGLRQARRKEGPACR